MMEMEESRQRRDRDGSRDRSHRRREDQSRKKHDREDPRDHPNRDRERIAIKRHNSRDDSRDRSHRRRGDRSRSRDRHDMRDDSRVRSYHHTVESSRERHNSRDDSRDHSHHHAVESSNRVGSDGRDERYPWNQKDGKEEPAEQRPTKKRVLTAADSEVPVQWGKKQDDNVGGKDELEGPQKEKIKADFGLSGALAKDERTGNTVNGVTLKWTEPGDAALPDALWRLYVFKGEENVETLHIHRQSSYLFGRDDRVCDVLLAHPSVSKQHAVIQHRSVMVETEVDDELIAVRQLKPYILDLNSTHKTFLNSKPLEDARYYELRERDVITFGGSTREYVVMQGGKKE